MACGEKQRRPTEKHCAWVGGVVDAEAPRHRTFTFREFVWLIENASPPSSEDPVARAQGAIEHAAALRNAAGRMSEAP